MNLPRRFRTNQLRGSDASGGIRLAQLPTGEIEPSRRRARWILSFAKRRSAPYRRVGNSTTTVGTLPCASDCNGDGADSIDELLSAANIAVGSAALDTCRAADINDDGIVTVDELIITVTRARKGCR